jgi:hypothetical protein
MADLLLVRMLGTGAGVCPPLSDAPTTGGGTDPLRFWLAAPVSRTKARRRRAGIPPVGLHGQGRAGAPSASLHGWDRVRHAKKKGPEVGVVVGLCKRRRWLDGGGWPAAAKRRRPIEWGRLGYIGRRTFGRWATQAAPLAGRLAGPRGCLVRATSTPPGWLAGCQAAGPAGSPL